MTDIEGDEQPAESTRRKMQSESGDGTDNHYKYWPGMQDAVDRVMPVLVMECN